LCNSQNDKAHMSSKIIHLRDFHQSLAVFATTVISDSLFLSPISETRNWKYESLRITTHKKYPKVELYAENIVPANW